MDKTVNVKENIMDELKPVFGDVPVPKGAIEAQVKRLWINQFGEVEPELLRQTSQAAQYEFERFPTRKQYHELLVKIASSRPLQEKPKSANDLRLEAINDRQQQAAHFLSGIEPDLHERLTDRAVSYYLANELCTAPEEVRGEGKARVVLKAVNANAKLRKVVELPEDQRNEYQQAVVKLLRANVFDFLIEAGHLDKFKQQVGL